MSEETCLGCEYLKERTCGRFPPQPKMSEEFEFMRWLHMIFPELRSGVGNIKGNTAVFRNTGRC